MKILIIRLSSIGDIVLTSPVIRCLKMQKPEAEVHFLTKRAYVPILASNPHLSKVIAFENNLSRTIKQLQEEKYDGVVDLHNNLRTALIKMRLPGIKKSFYKLNIEKWLMVNFKWNKLPAVHIVDRYMKTVEYWNIHNDGKGLDYFIPECDRVSVSDLPERHRKAFIAIVIGGKFQTKKLPVEKLIGICSKIKEPLVVIGGKEDLDVAVKIEQAIGERVFISCGRYNINQSASLVSLATAVLTNDTGLMHIAAAFGKKIVSVWGNTIPEFGMFPYFADGVENGSEIIEIKGLKCRPCSKIGFDRCPKGHFKCMNSIETDKVVTALSG